MSENAYGENSVYDPIIITGVSTTYSGLSTEQMNRIKIEQLEARVIDLERQIAELTARLNALEAGK